MRDCVWGGFFPGQPVRTCPVLNGAPESPARLKGLTTQAGRQMWGLNRRFARVCVCVCRDHSDVNISAFDPILYKVSTPSHPLRLYCCPSPHGLRFCGENEMLLVLWISSFTVIYGGLKCGWFYCFFIRGRFVTFIGFSMVSL